MSQSHFSPAGPASVAVVPPGLVVGTASGIDTRDATLNEVAKHVKVLGKFQYSMSYNDSYFGEPQGLVKRTVAALIRLVDGVPEGKPAMPFNEDDPAEVAYWEMDARIKGYNEWKGRPRSERDAFKAVFRKHLGG